MASKRRDVATERWWRDALARCAAGGLSVRAFCRRERLAESAFYFWRRTIAERDRIGRDGQSLKPAPRRRTPGFVPLRLIDAPPEDVAIVLELAGGRRLRLPEAIPAQRLAELVQALEARTCEARALEARALAARTER